MDAPLPPVPSPDAPTHIVHAHGPDGVLATDHYRQDAQELDHEAALHEPTSVTPNGLRSDHQLEQDLSASSTMTRSTPVTRTVAIIKHHALHHRFDIEPRIQEARFEIVKERQMEFDTETDPDALYDLFGEDADSLAEGPVWVYVLERKRAVEVWNTLMGDSDPEVARIQVPNSLRALYGISHQQNALMGSPDTQTAEIQIAALFASSPLFSSTDLPPEGDRYGSVRSISSSVLEALRADQSDQGYAGYAPSSVTNPSTVGGGSNGKPTFKARPVPATNTQPDIVPRMSRAAALRIGAPVEKSPNKPRAPPTKAQLAKTFENVPGHKRRETIAVASTAPPVIAPRMTKAASLRLGKEAAATAARPRPSPPVKKRSVTDGAVAAAKAQATFEGVPGHKRRETISVASVKPPTVAPRSNKSAVLRQSQKEAGGPAPSAAFRAPSAISRTTSAGTAASRRQSIAAPQRTESQVSRRSISALAIRSSTSTNSEAVDPLSPAANDNNNGAGAGTSRPASVASKPRPRPSSVVLPPTIAPRTNKSAALRAAKMEAEAAAAAAAAAKKTPRVARPPPSSFKPSTVAT